MKVANSSGNMDVEKEYFEVMCDGDDDSSSENMEVEIEDCEVISDGDGENEKSGGPNVSVTEPKVGMFFQTPDDAFLFYANYAKKEGFGAAKRTSKKRNGLVRNFTFQCCKGGKPKNRAKNPKRPRPQTKTNCPARVNLVRVMEEKWEISSVCLKHNHVFTPGHEKFYRRNRTVSESVKRQLVLNDKAGIRLHKTYESLQIRAGGYDNLTYLEKDLRNLMSNWRHSENAEGDATAMFNYFRRMTDDNSDFYYDMDLDDNKRLRNVFWADARSRAACKEFGDVVTFDTTYLANTHGMPFAPFVGVNHHGQSVLLGCGLISHEDAESFCWLFKTWMKCMWDCAPPAIITDQCMAMKNAIEQIFPNSRHRWCIWHIMKKKSEKLGRCQGYDSFSRLMQDVVYNSLTIDEFEMGWDYFIKEYKLENNEWLKALYSERKRWVPAFVKDIFWAGMSSTQRSESMNHFFDNYINSKTTLKQFVEQYENALGRKVQNEKIEDLKSAESYIPTIAGLQLEKQFHSVYTHAKVREFQQQFVGTLACVWVEKRAGEVFSEYDVEETITYGEDDWKRVMTFHVIFNSETNESSCNCRLFEFRGIVCKHQLVVWKHKRVQTLPDKYVLRRWRKDVTRAHTKIRIRYENSLKTVEEMRYDEMRETSDEVAYLARDSKENFEDFMEVHRNLKKKYLLSSVVDGSKSSADAGSCNDTHTLGKEPLKDNSTILNPESIKPKGRPREKRLVGKGDKIRKNKKEQKKKEQKKRKLKDVVNGVLPDLNDKNVGTQESFPIYTEQFIWPN